MQKFFVTAYKTHVVVEVELQKKIVQVLEEYCSGRDTVPKTERIKFFYTRGDTHE